MKKKRFIKLLTFGAALALSVSLFAACEPTGGKELSYNSGVVRAFNSVTPAGELISKTAVADGQDYLVTVITSSAVAEYSVDSGFKVGDPTMIVGSDAGLASKASLTALTAEEGTMSDLERAFEEALRLSGIAKSEVEGFDFDRDTYLGKSVFKVEIEDVIAEYSYILNADDLTLIESKTELKNAAPSDGTSSYIGEARAKAIALDAAGIGEKDAAEFAIKSILSGGRKIYKASFNYGGYRYDVEIDALNGDVVKFSQTVLDGTMSGPDVPAIISEAEAKDIAIAFAFPEGLGEKQAEFRKVKLDYEHGVFVYEVEFIVESNEYELEIAASDGAILDVEIEALEGRPSGGQTGESGGAAGQFISREEAIEKARALAGADAYVLEVDIDKEYVNGEKRYFYEVELRVNGREVEYLVDAVTGEVSLNEDYSGNPVTPGLTEDEALTIALDNFGLTKDALTSQKIKLEREDGRLCYEIELRVGNVEYSMCVDAQSGKILEREIEHEEEVPPQQDPSGFITREQAIEAVKKVAGANARISEVELDDEKTETGRSYFYEVEVIVDGREYEYYVDALTGDVRLKGELIAGGKDLIGEEEAVSIALKYFSLTAAEAKVTKVKLEEDDGILQYEVQFMVRNMEYTVEIDAVTGKILDKDISFD